MASVRIQIVRWVDGAFPCWVECALTDGHGARHVFIEKVPVVTLEHVDEGSAFPQPGTIRCVVVGERQTPGAGALTVIDTRTSDGIESTTGQTVFELHPDDIIVE